MKPLYVLILVILAILCALFAPPVVLGGDPPKVPSADKPPPAKLPGPKFEGPPLPPTPQPWQPAKIDPKTFQPPPPSASPLEQQMAEWWDGGETLVLWIAVLVIPILLLFGIAKYANELLGYRSGEVNVAAPLEEAHARWPGNDVPMHTSDE